MYTTENFLSDNCFVADARDYLPQHRTREWRKRQLDDLHGMVWHQTLSSSSAQAVASYHVGPNHISSAGLPAISYTFFIEPTGNALLCNPIEDITYSQGDRTQPGDENRRYIAVCFGGNFGAPGYIGSDHVTAEQMHTGLKLWLACCRVFGWSGRQLYGHYHFGKPQCPGIDLSNLIESIQDADESTAYRYDFDTTTGRQEALREAGHYDGPIDDLWGMQSRRALVAYQQAAGLTVDGTWGPETERALRRDTR